MLLPLPGVTLGASLVVEELTSAKKPHLPGSGRRAEPAPRIPPVPGEGHCRVRREGAACAADAVGGVGKGVRIGTVRRLLPTSSLTGPLPPATPLPAPARRLSSGFKF